MTSVERALSSLLGLQRAVIDVLLQHKDLMLKTIDGKADSLKHQAVRADLESTNFWGGLSRVVAILRPISRVIMAVHADAITISDVARYWCYLAKELQDPLCKTGQRDVIATAAACFNARAKEMDTPLIRLALLLDPRFKHLANVSTNPQSAPTVKLLTVTGGTVLKKRGYGKEAFLRFTSQLTMYIAGEAPFNTTCSSDSASVNMYWRALSLDSRASELSRLAVLLREVCPHAAALERTFSLFGLVQTDVRKPLQAENLYKIAAVKEHYMQKRAGNAPRLKVPKGLELVPAPSATEAHPSSDSTTEQQVVIEAPDPQEEEDDESEEEVNAGDFNEDIEGICDALAKAATADEALQREKRAVGEKIGQKTADQLSFKELLGHENIFGYYDFVTDPLVPIPIEGRQSWDLGFASDSDIDYDPFAETFMEETGSSV
jgi:hypothetical protein